MFSIRTVASIALSVAVAIGAGASLSPEMGDLTSNIAQKARVSLEAGTALAQSVMADSSAEFATWVDFESQATVGSEAEANNGAFSEVDGSAEVEAGGKHNANSSLLPSLGTLGLNSEGQWATDGTFGLNLR